MGKKEEEGEPYIQTYIHIRTHAHTIIGEVISFY